jgi:hypothetical protein
MAYKRTGRPPGRPKTKEYKTVLARIPAELADLVKRYAAERGQLPVSELIREGLEWRIGDGDPRGTGMYLSQPTGMSEKMYSSNTETEPGVQGEEALQGIRALLVQQGEQIQALTQALERQGVATSDGMYSSNTIIPATEVAISYQEARHTQPAPLAEEQVPGSAIPPSVPLYDPAKHHLGKLCLNKHEWGSTGQTLRNTDNQCLKCRTLAKREKDARKRAEQEAQPVGG